MSQLEEPSDYERAAWQDLQRIKPVRRVFIETGQRITRGAERVAERADQFLEGHPQAKSAIEGGRGLARVGGKVISRGAKAVKGGAQRVVEQVPEQVKDWTGGAAQATGQMVSRIARVGLSPDFVVRRHQKLGHNVEVFSDVRRLDLREVDVVRGRWYSLAYSAASAASGAGSALLITGGEITAGSGAGAAPGAGIVVSAVAADVAAVMALSSRAVGHVALLYGYDPEDPAEKLFVYSVINAGTALSGGAKQMATSDLSRLTQALYRGRTWQVLDEHVMAKVYKQLLAKLGFRTTKQGLAKFVPVAGVVMAAGFNWWTLDSIIDAANTAYRRRFLLEKYPQLAATDTLLSDEGLVPDENDELISVVDELRNAGGPDLHSY